MSLAIVVPAVKASFLELEGFEYQNILPSTSIYIYMCVYISTRMQ